MLDILRKIDAEDEQSHAGDICEWSQKGFIPHKVLSPDLLTRMKKRDDVAACRIDPGYVRSLVKIAAGTGQAQIVFGIVASVLLSHDVLQMKCGKRLMLLIQATILASVPSAFNDLPPGVSGNHESQDRRRVRAFD